MDGLGFTHDKFTLRVDRNHDVNHGTLHVLLLTYSSIFGSFVERLYRAAWRQRCFQSGLEHGREGKRGATTHLVRNRAVMRVGNSVDGSVAMLLRRSLAATGSKGFFSLSAGIY